MGEEDKGKREQEGEMQGEAVLLFVPQRDALS